MNCIVPFNKDIKFKTNIGEITSISLEHEITLNDTSLLGNFLISGDYKTHEVSVNTEKFNYTLPFDMSLPDNIIKESVSFDIEDFTYSVIKPDILKIDIEFRVLGQEEKQEPEILELPGLPLEEEKIEEISREEKVEEKEIVEETKVIENIPIIEIEEKEEIENEKEIPRIDKESETNIMNIGSQGEETFITYHIHIIKDGDSIEEICKMYNISNNLLCEYNDLSNITSGQKVIIPADE